MPYIVIKTFPKDKKTKKEGLLSEKGKITTAKPVIFITTINY